MPEPIEEFYISIGSDISKLLTEVKDGLNRVENRLGQTESRGKRAFSNIGAVVKKTATIIGIAAAAITGVIVTVNKLTDAYIKQQKADAQLAATLRSTGMAAGFTTEELKKQAAQLQSVTNIGDEVIETAQAMLATFTNIGKETFPRATEAILDVATAMNNGVTPGTEQLRATTIQLGKALNDPLKGLAALSRVGIQFTEQQKSQIETLAESGQTAKAQALILKELERQFGGSARAARVADQGFEAAANTISDATEKLGRQLIPLREGYVQALTVLAGKSEEKSSIVTNALAGIAAVAGTVVIAVKAMVENNIAALKVLGDTAKAVLNFEDPIAAAKASSAEYVQTIKKNANILLDLPNITRQAFTDIKAGWEEQRQAAEDAAVASAAPAKAVMDNITDDLQDLSEEQKKILQDAGRDLLDLQEETNTNLEANAKEHTQTLAEIETEGAKSRLEINEKFDKELKDSQAEIFKQAKDDLKRLEDETDREVAKRRKEANKQESRETEDHLTDMRRLRLSFLDNLEDAVKSRDAGRVRDLQRQFQRESQEREQDFQTKQSRERSDTQAQLAEVAANEDRRAQEIINHRTEALAEVERRVKENRDKELMTLDEKLATEKEKENARFAERQKELDAAADQRLKQLAKELADTEDLQEGSARNILKILNKTFGADGTIDELMKDFANRRRQTLTLEIGFETQEKRRTHRAPGAGSRGGRAGSIPSFQEGGTLLATKPTLAQFGEVPELVQFTPLSKMQGGGGGNQKIEVDLKLSGSAPPGIRSGDRDAIAGVLVNALKEAGLNDVKRGR